MIDVNSARGVPLIRSAQNYFHIYWRIPKILQLITPFVGKNESVLDVGSGFGFLSEALQKYCRTVTQLDVRNRNRTNIPIVIYDGSKMPFQDKSFDTVILVFILSEIKQWRQVLHEAWRIAKKQVIILETIPCNTGELTIAKIRDLFMFFTLRNCYLDRKVFTKEIDALKPKSSTTKSLHFSGSVPFVRVSTLFSVINKHE